VAGLADHQVTAPAQDPYRLRLDQRPPGGGVRRVQRDQPALGLRHDLLGDDEAVAVGQGCALIPRRAHDELGDHVTGTDLA
jgi:hypothetical protein